MKTNALLLSLIVLAVAVPVHAQQDSTLARILSGRIDSTANGFSFYFSPGFNRRADGLAALFADADEIVRDSLGVLAKINVAMLVDPDWHRIQRGSYGEPFISDGPPWVVVVPAAPQRSVLFSQIGDRIGEDVAAAMIDNLAFLEAGRVYSRELLLPDTAQETPPLHWFDDFLAHYLAYSVVSKVAPEMAVIWDINTWKVLEEPIPQFTTLDEFEKKHSGFRASAEGRQNDEWYQSLFASRVAELYHKHGIGFLAELKQRLPSDGSEEWTTTAVLAVLAAMDPGFLGWPHRERE